MRSIGRSALMCEVSLMRIGDQSLSKNVLRPSLRAGHLPANGLALL